MTKIVAIFLSGYSLIFLSKFVTSFVRPFPSLVCHKRIADSVRTDTSLSLDIEDILDDDFDFLSQLKKQIENPLSATPREVTNRIKGFFSTTRRSPLDIDAFRSYLEANKHVLDVVNAILILDGCARTGIPPKSVISKKYVNEAMERASNQLTSSMVLRGITCMKNMPPNDEESAKFLKLLWERIKESNVLMDGPEVCTAIFNMQTVNLKLPEVKELILYFSKSLAACNMQLPAKTLSSALFGKYGGHSLSVGSIVCFHTKLSLPFILGLFIYLYIFTYRWFNSHPIPLYPMLL